MPQLSTRDKALEEWASRTAGIRSSQELPLQAYVLYSIRFIYAAHMVSAWANFGGIAAQFNALGVLPNLAAIENSGVAIAYDTLLRNHIAYLARQPGTPTSFGC